MERLTGNDEIDLILSREDEILPSSGFALSVMDAVRREAAALPPIPFPWRRALPGLVVGGLALGLIMMASIFAMARLGGVSASSQFSMSPPSGMPSLFHGGVESATAWTVLALVTAFVSVRLSMRLASDRT
jgi:hypothetical protein